MRLRGKPGTGISQLVLGAMAPCWERHRGGILELPGDVGGCFPPRPRPKVPTRDLVIFKTTKSPQQVKKSLRVGPKWPTLYGDFVVHGPSPYKNCPPEQFLATLTVVCTFITKMGSVGMCRDGDNLSPHLLC